MPLVPLLRCCLLAPGIFLLAVSLWRLPAEVSTHRNIARSTSAPAPRQTPTPAPPQLIVEDLGQGVRLELVRLPDGDFTMGSNEYDDEKPPHPVRLRSFFMGKYEVTRAQYRAVMGSLPDGRSKGDDRPVERVSWDDANAFCQKLSNLSGRWYRLPTEAEWEYACRAGSDTSYSFGADEKQLAEYAWYEKNSDDQTHLAGQKKPNAFGLYDLHGNVWEWCADWYGKAYYRQSPRSNPKGPEAGTARVLRGGSWYVSDWLCRSASRLHSAPGVRSPTFGFRVVVSARVQ